VGYNDENFFHRTFFLNIQADFADWGIHDSLFPQHRRYCSFVCPALFGRLFSIGFREEQNAEHILFVAKTERAGKSEERKYA
jgi:hypothetical protein